MSEEQAKEFERLAREVMKFLCNEGHPHMHVYITCNTAELSEGSVAFSTNEYIKD